MKNLKENRLGYEFTNALGHKCKVTAYKSNKEVVVHDTATNKFHTCRWCDLKNVRCPAVYDATAARRRFGEELDKVSAINTVTKAEKSADGANSARTDLSDEVIRKVKESENWAFEDEIKGRYQEEVEEEKGCAASAIVMGIAVVVFVTILCIVL